MNRLQTVQKRFAKHGQGHVLHFAETLEPAAQEAILDQLEAVDLELLDRLIAEMVLRDPAPTLHGGELVPETVIRLPQTEAEREHSQQARSAGEDLLRGGKVAILTAAGGQGTRLGFAGPKGSLEIGPVSSRSLFELHALKIRALAGRYGVSVPWYIMTSESNDAETRRFLEAHEYFGLPARDVRPFTQCCLPVVDFAGKILLESPGRIATSPDGHGGSVRALAQSGGLADLAARGIEEIFYFQVDNPLIQIADPVFLGHHRLAGAEMSSKVVRKRGWSEPVGVLCRRGGTLGVIEYTELPEELAQETTAPGELRFWAGSIAVHVLRVEFMQRLTRERESALPFHSAVKKVPHVNERGERVEPDEPNAVKFETFIFDALAQARTSVTVETDRADEFSPVKTATGPDSLAAARTALVELYGRWLERAGVAVPRRPDGTVDGRIEIGPLLALTADDLAARIGARVTMVRGETLTLDV